MQLLSALIAGLLFGAGLALSGMVNPAKVVNFFDIAGSWDASLIFVMAGALAVTLSGYRLVLRRQSPLYASGFSLPTAKDIDRRLVGGAALFGLGWGLAGLCPGPAVASLTTMSIEPVIFIAAMGFGMVLVRRFVLRPA